VWVASTAAAGLGTANFTGLRWGRERLVRSRFPNTNPELGMGPMFQPQDWAEPAWCAGGNCANPPQRFEPPSPSRANESRSGTLYTLGIGGDGCSLFSPPAGFNCVDNQRWGGMVLRWPAGFRASASDMPHTPYSSAVADPRNPAQLNGWCVRSGAGWRRAARCPPRAVRRRAARPQPQPQPPPPLWRFCSSPLSPTLVRYRACPPAPPPLQARVV
jgi:hypothetical protein